jgi:hypothetical protein
MQVPRAPTPRRKQPERSARGQEELPVPAVIDFTSKLNDFAPLATVTLIVSSSTREKLMFNVFPAGFESVKLPA